MTRDRNENRIVDRLWVEIFHDYDVLEHIGRHGYFEITSKQIKEYKEARLMTKFDYLTALPDIFYDNDLSILPITRGRYVIGRFDAYQPLKTTDKTLLKDRREIRFPDWIETIKTENITSESTMLNAASVSGMIGDLFNEDEVVQTVSGRMSSGSFSFSINGKGSGQNYELDVKNSQLEIDGGFETPDKLILFEAKNNTTNSFLIRQLYYPYQLWAKKISKQVVPVFLQYANETYNFSVFEFDDPYDYNSLRLVERRNYIFGGQDTSMTDIVNIQKTVKVVPDDPTHPFPQADSIYRVIGVVEAIRDSAHSRVSLEELTIKNDFVMRQAQYYSRAAMYLGLVKRFVSGDLLLTDLGLEYVLANRRKKNLIIAKSILEHKAFNLVFERGLSRGKPLSARETSQFLESEGFYEIGLSPTTRRRRSSTVASWVRYLFSMVDDY